MNMNSGKKGPPQAPPKYLNDFSKALSNEVRILLQEVGQLRDERRALQYEIAELLAVKSKHGAGGEYTPDWRPSAGLPEALPPPPAPPAIEDGPKEPAKPAWRTVVKHERRDRKHKTAAPQQIAAAPIAAPAPTMSQMPAWAQWKPNPLLSPAPRIGTTAAPLPTPPPPKAPDGLFGPKTPPPK
ncbi:hypothetical protein DFH11DRAFT_388966 [Phellopilus nigrolimitatus]|nr:hypothetical protein DFH11DRAFT_388966 [Phellopilus nigrolimitatus]